MISSGYGTLLGRMNRNREFCLACFAALTRNAVCEEGETMKSSNSELGISKSLLCFIQNALRKIHSMTKM